MMPWQTGGEVHQTYEEDFNQNRFPIVRSKVKTLLARSVAYQSLPADKRRQIAGDMVKVTNYLVSDSSRNRIVVTDGRIPARITKLRSVFSIRVNLCN